MQSTFPLALGDRVTIKPAHLSRHILQGVTINSEEKTLDPDVTDGRKHRKIYRPFVIKAKKHDKEDKDERELERQRIKEERYGRIMDDLKFLRDHYKHKYMKALGNKVNKQRKELKEREIQMEQRQKLKEELREKKRAEEKQKLPRGELLINDSQFKKKLQKTEYHKIIKLENKLRKQGSLDKTHELNEFWEIASVPGNLDKVLNEGEVTWKIIKSYQRDAAGRVIIDQNQENENNGAIPVSSAEKWLTNKHTRVPTMAQPLSPVTEISVQGSSPTESQKITKNEGSNGSANRQGNTQLTLEQKFLKVEFPPLAAYRLQLGPHEPDPDEVRRQAEKQQRLESRQEHRWTMNKMFTHALANKAATLRLLQRKKDSGFDSLSSVCSSVKEVVVSNPTKDERLEPSQSLERNFRGNSDYNSQLTVKDPRSTNRRSSKKRSDSQMSKLSTNATEMLSDSEDSDQEKSPAPPPPLALEHLIRKCQIKEAIRPSSFWVNPANQDQFNTQMRPDKTHPLGPVGSTGVDAVPDQRVKLFDTTVPLLDSKT